MHRVFVSFYHRDDQGYKDALVKWAKENEVFIGIQSVCQNPMCLCEFRLCQ